MTGTASGKPHLEPWQCSNRSISSVGPSISVYYDIEIETFDIERYKMTFDIETRYELETRYRMFCNSISNALNPENIDIEGRNIRYRSSNTMLKLFYSISNVLFFDIGVFLSDPAWAAYSVQDTD